MRVLPYGDRALLVELADTAQAVRCGELVREHPVAGELLADLVPGARTVLLVGRSGVVADRLRALLPSDDALAAAEPGAGSGGAGGSGGAAPATDAATVVIPVVYDGPDLASVAEMTGLSPDEVVAAHTGQPWRVAFGGFAPGFAYLAGGDPRLQVPRRPEPRTAVPAGAVALAGEFSGIYPRPSPGGWQLIGYTDAVMWDLQRPSPALLAAGVTVRFEAT